MISYVKFQQMRKEAAELPTAPVAYKEPTYEELIRNAGKWAPAAIATGNPLAATVGAGAYLAGPGAKNIESFMRANVAPPGYRKATKLDYANRYLKGLKDSGQYDHYKQMRDVENVKRVQDYVQDAYPLDAVLRGVKSEPGYLAHMLKDIERMKKMYDEPYKIDTLKEYTNPKFWYKDKPSQRFVPKDPNAKYVPDPYSRGFRKLLWGSDKISVGDVENTKPALPEGMIEARDVIK